MHRLYRFLLAASVFGLLVAAVPGEKSAKPEKEFRVNVTEEMIRHSRIRDALYFGGTLWTIAALVLILTTRLSARMRDTARRLTSRPFLQAMLYFLFLLLALTVLEFPLTYYSGFVVSHQFDLSNQSFLEWLWDSVKALLVNLVVLAPIAALALLAIRRFRQWWRVLWIGSIPIIVLLVVIAPVVIDPLFNDFQPLRDVTLRDRLLAQADRAGIDGTRVYEVNKSKQTRTMNAYVTGIGPTKRIVLWDTLLAKMSHDEIVAVMAHEMGHYVLHHVWKGVAFSIFVSLIVFRIGQACFERGLTRFGGRWGIESPHDPAALPWLLILVVITMFLMDPAINGFSRRIEHQADVFALELTGLREPMATAFIKFAEDSKVDPSPHPFIEWWRYSHPSIENRLEFVLGER